MNKIVIAEQEKLKFNSKIEAIFLDYILEEGSLMTDESRLIDFVGMFDISYSKEKLNNGLYLFEFKSKRNLHEENYTIKIIEDEGTNEKEKIRCKVKRIFDIDIADSFGLTMPVLFQKIQKETPEINKKKLGLI